MESQIITTTINHLTRSPYIIGILEHLRYFCRQKGVAGVHRKNSLDGLY